MQIVTGTSASLNPGLLTGLGRYRHRVFVERLGWQLRSANELEFDQFDRDDTIYVVALDDAGEIVGTARLLPTTQPYLLGDVFPELLDGQPAPRTPDVWELSRFASMDFSAQTSSALAQCSSPIAIGLMHASIACARAHGAARLVSVSPLGVERLFSRAGFRWSRAGRPMQADKGYIVAGYIAFD